MIGSFGNQFDRKPPQKGSPMMRESVPDSLAPRKLVSEKTPTYTKIFRWRLPDGQTVAPHTVEIVGSFTQWEKLPLTRDSAQDAWHVTIHHIPGNRTHHYMLLVDGHPVQDKNADGMAIPHGPQEEQFQLATARGGRVFMLYAQTK
jgi:hypothetical protein